MSKQAKMTDSDLDSSTRQFVKAWTRFPCEWSRTHLAVVCRDGQLSPASSSRVYFFAVFFIAAHRALAAAEILARPSGERVRFAFLAAFAGLAEAFTTFTAPAGRPLFFAWRWRTGQQCACLLKPRNLGVDSGNQIGYAHGAILPFINIALECRTESAYQREKLRWEKQTGKGRWTGANEVLPWHRKFI